MSSSFYPSNGNSWLQSPMRDQAVRRRQRRLPTVALEIAVMVMALAVVAYSLL